MSEASDLRRSGAGTLLRRVLHPGHSSLRACTIVARNYLAQAEVLARSFRKFNPDCRFTILVIDDLESRTTRDDEIEILGLADIGLATGDAYRMPVIYDVTELSTAVKPWLLQHLRGGGEDVVIYFDPDIEIFSPLDQLAELARRHSIVLTPHVTEPIPQDRRRLNESDILGSGIYNLGFIAVGAGSEDFLSWWSSRLRRECVIDPARMRFTDQRWIDFVPGLFRHYILRDPGYNVAYWNLHGRKVVRDGDSYTVNGKPLRFFHFSGYNPDFPHILSKHQGARPRVLLSEHPGVRRLCKEYRQQLREAGFDQSKRNPYGFETLSNGLRLDQRLRRIYRESLAEAEMEEADTNEPPSPFAPAGEAAFLGWLNKPVDAMGVGVTRFMLAIHAEREDLRNAFPQPRGADAQGFYSWFLRDQHIQAHVHFTLMPGGVASVAERVTKPELPQPLEVEAFPDAPVVNVAGYFRAELGIGEAARLILSGLKAAGVPYRTISHNETINRQSHPFADQIGAGASADINIICVNADQTPAFMEKMGQEFARDRYTIGVWFWEIEDFPVAFQRAFDYVDEVWVATEFIRQAVSKVSDKSVFKFHLPLAHPALAERTELSEEKSDRPFTFLYSFDFMSVLERKNPIGVINAFKKAFKPGEGPILRIKTINGDKKVLELERVRLAAISRPDIVIADGYLSAAEKEAMMASCDCYVSLHRSEGYGLTMAEAMSLGKPVIATGYSGNLEFMTADNSYLCSYEYTEIGYGSEPYPPASHWAQPNLDEAAQFMRQVYSQREEARQRGLRGAEDIRTFHSPAVAGGAIKDRLQAIRARRARYGKALPMDVVEQRLEALEALPQASSRIFAEERERLVAAEKRVNDLARGLIAQQALGERQSAEVQERLLSITQAASEQRQVLVASGKAHAGSIEELKVFLAEEEERVSKIASTQADIRKGLERRLEALEAMANVTQETQQRSQALQERLEGLETTVASLQNSHLLPLQEMLPKVANRLEEIASHIEAAPYMANPALLTREANDSPKTLGYSDTRNYLPNERDSYLSFEDVFRGPEELIRERQRIYLDLLREHEPIVDLGSGRGEMLDLLKASHIHAIGVDLDPGMVQHSRSKGHEVLHEDVVTYLKRQPDASIGGIFCAQVIEHLPYESLQAILQLGRKKIKPAGILILETVNPHSHRALKTFWVDLTHNKPIFPEVLVMLCHEAGYGEATVQFPCGKGDFEKDRLWEGEYAVIARNPSLAVADLPPSAGHKVGGKKIRRARPVRASNPEVTNSGSATENSSG